MRHRQNIVQPHVQPQPLPFVNRAQPQYTRRPATTFYTTTGGAKVGDLPTYSLSPQAERRILVAKPLPESTIHL